MSFRKVNHRLKVDTLLDLMFISPSKLISRQKGSTTGCFYSVDDYLFIIKKHRENINADLRIPL